MSDFYCKGVWGHAQHDEGWLRFKESLTPEEAAVAYAQWDLEGSDMAYVDGMGVAVKLGLDGEEQVLKVNVAVTYEYNCTAAKI